MLARLTKGALEERLADKTAEMIGASRRILVSQTREPAGDDVRASCDLGGLISRLKG